MARWTLNPLTLIWWEIKSFQIARASQWTATRSPKLQPLTGFSEQSILSATKSFLIPLPLYLLCTDCYLSSRLAALLWLVRSFTQASLLKIVVASGYICFAKSFLEFDVTPLCSDCAPEATMSLMFNPGTSWSVQPRALARAQFLGGQLF